jgi:uncharacterized protein YjiS (DUF1127 family)
MFWIDIEEAAARARLRVVGEALRTVWRSRVRRRREEVAVRQLARLDAHLLRDIGIERADIRRVVHSGRR